MLAKTIKTTTTTTRNDNDITSAARSYTDASAGARLSLLFVTIHHTVDADYEPPFMYAIGEIISRVHASRARPRVNESVFFFCSTSRPSRIYQS